MIQNGAPQALFLPGLELLFYNSDLYEVDPDDVRRGQMRRGGKRIVRIAAKLKRGCAFYPQWGDAD